MMLLHLLHQMQLPVLAAHVHHGLRAEEADRDEKAVELFCEKLKIPLEILHTDIKMHQESDIDKAKSTPYNKCNFSLE